MGIITSKVKPKKPAIEKYNDTDSTSGKPSGKSNKKFNIYRKGK